MTRKTRRSKPGGSANANPESGKGSARETRPELENASPLDADPQGPGEHSAPEEESGESSPQKKVTLPAFGFAADLLSKTSEEKATAEADDDDAAAVTEAVAAEGQTDDVVAAPVVDAADPRRIFAFADGLERSAIAEPEAAPVRLETWVAFSLAGEVFALPVTPVREVVKVATITRVPHAPRPIRGVTNRRGRVIPVIDLRLRIELPSAELGRASRVIVVSSRGRLLGLLVDAVHQVIHIDLEQVQPPPDDVMTIQSNYLSGVYHLDDQLILLLDIDRALIIQDAAPEATDSPATDSAAAAEASAS